MGAAAAAVAVAPPHSEPVDQLPFDAGRTPGEVHILDAITGEEVTKVPISTRGTFGAGWKVHTMNKVKKEAREMLDLDHPVEEPEAKRRRIELRGGEPGLCFMCQETEPVKEVRAFQCFDSKGQVRRHEEMWTCKDCLKKYIRLLLDGNGKGEQYRKMDSYGDDHNHWTLNFACMHCQAKTLATWNEMH